MQEPAPGAPPAPLPAPSAGSSTTATVLTIVGVVFLSMFLLPFLMFATMDAGDGDDGPGSVVGLLAPLLLLAVVLAIVASRLSPALRGEVQASRPGFPAPFGAPLYGIPFRGSFADRLRLMPPGVRALHANVLWGLAGLVGAAGLGILAAIVLGPAGAEAATAGLLLLLGWLLTVGAYFAAGSRAFLPTAAALGLYGLLLHVQSVADAWGMEPGWHSEGLLLLVVLAPLQAFAAEAAYRRPPRALWAAWAVVGLLMAAAFPLVMFLDGSESQGFWADLAAGLALGSIAWGGAAAFAFPALPGPVRWGGVAVFALWAASIVYAMASGSDLGGRLQAAGLVAAAIVAAVAVTAYFVARPRLGRPAA